MASVTPPTGDWPSSAGALVAEQQRLALVRPVPWRVDTSPPPSIGGCFVCFPTGLAGAGHRGDPAWAAASLCLPSGEVADAVVEGLAGHPYQPGLLALREGPSLAAAVRALPGRPDVLLVNAAGRDHPRRAGMALHLGAVLGVPTVGVTHRAFLATGAWPGEERGATSLLHIGTDEVGAWVRTRGSRRPVAAHAAWRTDTATAIEVVLSATGRARTPEPLRQARRAARKARARAEERLPGGS